MTLLNLQHVQRVYNPNSANPVMALKDITFKVEEGEYVAIMGESGAGKSTLLNIIATLEQATNGQAILMVKISGSFPKTMQLVIGGNISVLFSSISTYLTVSQIAITSIYHLF